MLLKILKKHILKNPIIFLINLITISLILFSIVFSNFILLNIKNNLIQTTFWNQSNKFTIQKKENLLISNFLFKQQTLSDIYQKLQNDKNISKVFWIYVVNLPISAKIAFWPLDFSTDIFLFSSDEWNLCFSWKYIALWINPTLINLYNLQIANPPLFPKITPELLSKLNIVLTFWKNSFIKSNKSISKNAKITVIDNDLPVFWLTIWYKVAKEIIHNLWFGNQKLIKIIWYTKDTNYLKSLKKKYPNFKVTTFFDTQKQIYKKLQTINKIFEQVIAFILILSVWFLINFSVNLLNKYDHTIKVFYYNKMPLIKWFLIIIGEIFVYLAISTFIILIFTYIFNSHIQEINQLVHQKWYFITIIWFNFTEILKIGLELFTLMSVISGLTYYFKYRKVS